MGHKEGDTVIGAAHKQAIVPLVKRKSGFAVLAKVPNKSDDLVGRAIEVKLKRLDSWVKTMAVDNGKEFADHQAIDQALGIQTYFADPYCIWQRGSNENFNGLLRQYILHAQGQVFTSSSIRESAACQSCDRVFDRFQ